MERPAEGVGHQEPTSQREAIPKADFKLQTLYLNIRRLTELVGEAPVKLALSITPPVGVSDRSLVDCRFGACGRVLRTWLLQNWRQVEPLERLLLTGRLSVGKVFTTERGFYCRNLRPRVNASKAPAQLSTKYEVIARSVDLVLRANSNHLLPGSPGDLLSGRVANLFVVGLATKVTPSKVEGIPLFVGHRLDPTSDVLVNHATWNLEVHVDDIDNFFRCRGESFVRDRELKTLKAIPEEAIKNSIAKLLDEDLVPRDWGGERSDLFSTRLSISGRRVSTAFIFKGPARFHPMTLADLGKNGDQIDRVFTEPAELLVLQHCHRVTAGVRNMLRAYATRTGDPRRYCVIDGGDTLRILRAYGLCGQKSKPRKERKPPEDDYGQDEYEGEGLEAETTKQ